MTSTNNKQFVTPSAKMNTRSIAEKQKLQTHDKFLEPPVPSVCTLEMLDPLISIQHLWLSSTVSRKIDTLKVTTP